MSKRTPTNTTTRGQQRTRRQTRDAGPTPGGPPHRPHARTCRNHISRSGRAGPPHSDSTGTRISFGRRFTPTVFPTGEAVLPPGPRTSAAAETAAELEAAPALLSNGLREPSAISDASTFASTTLAATPLELQAGAALAPAEALDDGTPDLRPLWRRAERLLSVPAFFGRSFAFGAPTTDRNHGAFGGGSSTKCAARQPGRT